MCIYSVKAEDTRPAKASESLVTHQFAHAIGFTAAAEPGVALCVLPGSTLRFAQPIQYQRIVTELTWLGTKKIIGKETVVSQYSSAVLVEVDEGDTDKDALQFSDGTQVLLIDVVVGQRAYVENATAKQLMSDAVAMLPEGGLDIAHEDNGVEPCGFHREGWHQPNREGWLAPERT